MNKIWKVVLIVIASVLGVVGLTFLGVYLTGGFDKNDIYPENLFFANVSVDEEGNTLYTARGANPYYEYENFKLVLSTTTEEFNRSDVSLSFPTTQTGSVVTYLREVNLDEVLAGGATSVYYAYDAGGDILKFGSCRKEDAQYVTNGNVIVPVKVRINSPFDVFLCVAPDDVSEEIEISEDGLSVLNKLYNLGGYAEIIAKSSNVNLGSTRAYVNIDVPVEDISLIGITGDNISDETILGLNERVLKDTDENGRLDVGTEGLFSVIVDITPARAVYRYGRNGDFSEAQYKTVIFSINPDEEFISFTDSKGDEIADESVYSSMYVFNQGIDLRDIFGDEFDYSNYDISFHWADYSSVLNSVKLENGSVYINIKDNNFYSNFEVKVVARNSTEEITEYIYGYDGSLRLGSGAKVTTRGAILRTGERSNAGGSQVNAGIFKNSILEDEARANAENSPSALFAFMESDASALTASTRFDVKEIAIDGFEVTEADRFNSGDPLDLTINKSTKVYANNSNSNHSLGIKISANNYAQNKIKNILMSIQYRVGDDWYDATQANALLGLSEIFNFGYVNQVVTGSILGDSASEYHNFNFYQPYSSGNMSYWDVTATSLAEYLEERGIEEVKMFIYYLSPEDGLVIGKEGYGPYDIKVAVNDVVDTDVSWKDSDLKTSEQLSAGEFNETVLIDEKIISLENLYQIDNLADSPTYTTVRFFIYHSYDNTDLPSLDEIFNVKKYLGEIIGVSGENVAIYEVDSSDLKLIVSDLKDYTELEFYITFAIIKHNSGGVPVVDGDGFYSMVSWPEDAIGRITSIPIKIQKTLKRIDVEIDTFNGTIAPYKEEDARSNETYFLQRTDDNISFSITVEDPALFELLARKGNIKLSAQHGDQKTNDVFLKQGNVDTELENALRIIFENDEFIANNNGDGSYTYTISLSTKELVAFTEDEKETTISLTYEIYSDDIPASYTNPRVITADKFYIYSGKILELNFGAENNPIVVGSDGKIYVEKSFNNGNFSQEIYIKDENGDKVDLDNLTDEYNNLLVNLKDFGINDEYKITIIEGDTSTVQLNYSNGKYSIAFLKSGEIELMLRPLYAHSGYENKTITIKIESDYELSTEYNAADNEVDSRIIGYVPSIGYSVLGSEGVEEIPFEALIDVFAGESQINIANEFSFYVDVINSALIDEEDGKIEIIKDDNGNITGFKIKSDFGRSASLVISAVSQTLGTFEFSINIIAYDRVYIERLEGDASSKPSNAENNSYGFYAETGITVAGFEYQKYVGNDYVSETLDENTLKYFLFDEDGELLGAGVLTRENESFELNAIVSLEFEDYKLKKIRFAEVADTTKYYLMIRSGDEGNAARSSFENSYNLVKEIIFYISPNIKIDEGDLDTKGGNIGAEDGAIYLNNKDKPIINGEEISVACGSDMIISFNNEALVKFVRIFGGSVFNSDLLKMANEPLGEFKYEVSGVKSLSEQTIEISYAGKVYTIKYYAAPNIQKDDNAETVIYDSEEYLEFYAGQESLNNVEDWFSGEAGDIAVDFGQIATGTGNSRKIKSLVGLYSLVGKSNLTKNDKFYAIEKTPEGLIKTTIIISCGTGGNEEFIEVEILIFPFEWSYVNYDKMDGSDDVRDVLNGVGYCEEIEGGETYLIETLLNIPSASLNSLSYKLFLLVNGNEIQQTNTNQNSAHIAQKPDGLSLITQALGERRNYKIEFTHSISQGGRPATYTFSYYFSIDGTQTIEVYYPYADEKSEDSSSEFDGDGDYEYQNIYYSQFSDNQYTIDLNSIKNNFQGKRFVQLLVGGVVIDQSNSEIENYNRLIFDIYKIFDFSTGTEISNYAYADYIEKNGSKITLRNYNDTTVGYIIKISTPNGAVAYYKIITSTATAPITVIYKDDNIVNSTDPITIEGGSLNLKDLSISIGGVTATDVKFVLINESSRELMTEDSMMYINGDGKIVVKASANTQRAILVIYTKADGVIFEGIVEAKSNYSVEMVDETEGYSDSEWDLSKFLEIEGFDVEDELCFNIVFHNEEDLDFINYPLESRGSEFYVYPVSSERELRFTVYIWGGDLRGDGPETTCIFDGSLTIKPNIRTQDETGETCANGTYEIDIKDLFDNVVLDSVLEDYYYDVEITWDGASNERISLSALNGDNDPSTSVNSLKLIAGSSIVELHIGPVATSRNVIVKITVYKKEEEVRKGEAFNATFTLTVKPDTTLEINYPDYGSGVDFTQEYLFWEDYSELSEEVDILESDFVKFLTNYTGISHTTEGDIVATAVGKYIALFKDGYYLIEAAKEEQSQEITLKYFKILSKNPLKEVDTPDESDFIKFLTNYTGISRTTEGDIVATAVGKYIALFEDGYYLIEAAKEEQSQDITLTYFKFNALPLLLLCEENDRLIVTSEIEGATHSIEYVSSNEEVLSIDDNGCITINPVVSDTPVDITIKVDEIEREIYHLIISNSPVFTASYGDGSMSKEEDIADTSVLDSSNPFELKSGEVSITTRSNTSEKPFEVEVEATLKNDGSESITEKLYGIGTVEEANLYILTDDYKLENPTGITDFDILGEYADSEIAEIEGAELIFKQTGTFAVKLTINQEDSYYYYVVVEEGSDDDHIGTWYKDSETKHLSLKTIFPGINLDMYNFSIAYDSSMGEVISSHNITEPSALLNYYYIGAKIPYDVAKDLYNFEKEKEDGEISSDTLNYFRVMENSKVEYGSRLVKILNHFGTEVAQYKYQVIYDAKFPDANFNVLKKEDNGSYTYSQPGVQPYSSEEQRKLEGYFDTSEEEEGFNTIKISRVIELKAGTSYSLIDYILRGELGLTAVDGSRFDEIKFKSTAVLTHGTYCDNEEYSTNIPTILGLAPVSISGTENLKDYSITPHGAENNGNIVHLRLTFGEVEYVLRIKIQPNVKITAHNNVELSTNYYQNQNESEDIMHYKLSEMVNLSGVNAEDLVVSILDDSDSQFVLGEGNQRLVHIVGDGADYYAVRLRKTILGGAVLRFVITDKFGYKATDQSGNVLDAITLNYLNEIGESPQVVQRPDEIFEGNAFVLAYQDDENYYVYEYKEAENEEGEWKWSLKDSNEVQGKKLILLDKIASDLFESPSELKVKLTEIDSNLKGKVFAVSGADQFKVNYLTNTYFGGSTEISGEIIRLTIEYNHGDFIETVSLNLRMTIKQRYELRLKSPYKDNPSVYFAIDQSISLEDLFELYDLENNKVAEEAEVEWSEIEAPDPESSGYLELIVQTGELKCSLSSETTVEFNSEDRIAFGGIQELKYEITGGADNNIYQIDYSITPKIFRANTSGQKTYSTYGVVIPGKENIVDISHGEWAAGIVLEDYYGNEITEISDGDITYKVKEGSAIIDEETGEITGLSADQFVVINIVSNEVVIGEVKVTLSQYYGLNISPGVIEAVDNSLPFETSDPIKKGWGQWVETYKTGSESTTAPIVGGSQFGYTVVSHDSGPGWLTPTIEYSEILGCYVVQNIANATEIVVEVSYMGNVLGYVALMYVALTEEQGTWVVPAIEKTKEEFKNLCGLDFTEFMIEPEDGKGVIVATEEGVYVAEFGEGLYSILALKVDDEFVYTFQKIEERGGLNIVGSSDEIDVLFKGNAEVTYENGVLTISALGNYVIRGKDGGGGDQAYIVCVTDLGGYYKYYEIIDENAVDQPDGSVEFLEGSEVNKNHIFYIEKETTDDEKAIVTNHLNETTIFYALKAKDQIIFDSKGGNHIIYDENWPESNPKKDGYRFNGWFTDEECETKYNYPGNITGIVILYAKWSDGYKITFDSRGGSAVDDQTIYKEEEEVEEPHDPTKLGYTFAGWYTDEECENEYDFSTTPVTGDITLYAKWELIGYSITYDLGDVTAVETFTVENLPITLFTPTKLGYTFEDWYYESDFSGVVITAIEEGTIGNLILYAKWELIEYSIAYDLNYGDWGDEEIVQKFTVEDLYGITLPTPTKPGYTFAGWYTSLGEEGERIDTIEEDTIEEIEEGNILNLYAKWELIEYSIAYNLNNGAWGDVTPVLSFNVEDLPITLSTPTKLGYAFEGWYTSLGEEGELIATIEEGTIGNLTLYAKWAPKEYALLFITGVDDSYEREVAYGDSLDEIVFPKLGHSFEGWYLDSGYGTPAEWEIIAEAAGSSESVALYAKWAPKKYDLSFKDGEDTISTNSDVGYGSDITIPTPEGSTFKYWYIEFESDDETVFFILEWRKKIESEDAYEWVSYLLYISTGEPGEPVEYIVDFWVGIALIEKEVVVFTAE